MKKQLSFLLALALLLTSCGGGAKAAAMRLRKTEGSVGVADSDGRRVEPQKNLGLYSGYEVNTSADSYAWIDLDRVKLTKLDQDSEIKITKDGKKLDIEVISGAMFFNVTKPLASDESMNIRTSTMALGIRGTCGWVTEDTAALLEGEASVTAGAQSATVSAGTMAVLTEDGTLEVKPLTAASVPAFVKAELENDSALAEAVKADSGLDVLNAPAIDFSDPIHLRDMYAYSKALTYYPDGKLVCESETFPDEQGRIGRSVTQYLDRDLRYEWEYIYNDEGTLSKREGSNGTTIIVTEDTADYRKTVSGSSETITYYDEQGRMTKSVSVNGFFNIFTYDGEMLIRSDSYRADGSLMSYVLYEYDGTEQSE